MAVNFYKYLADVNTPCTVCGDTNELKAHVWTDGIICAKCWPKFKAENYSTSNCRHCRAGFDHRNDLPEIPTLCEACKSKRHTCEGCGDEFFSQSNLRICPTCQQEVWKGNFWKTVPPLYQETKRSKIPCQSAVEAAMRFDRGEIGESRGKTGAYLWGDSGGGKTRTMYAMACEWAGDGMDVAVIRGQEFNRDVVERTRPNGSGALGSYIGPLVEAGVLCIDEVDKIKLSERVEAEFFDLFERRLANQRVTVFTSNLTADEFAQRFSDNYRDAVRRRLFEMFEPIKFQL